MSPSRVNTPLQHICSQACIKIQLCTALQHTSSLAYLEYCEIPSCASTDAVLKKIVEKLGGNSWKCLPKQWFLLRKTTISEVDVTFVGTPLPPMSFLTDYSQLSISQLEAQRSPYLVRFSQKQATDFPAKAIHSPEVVAYTVSFVSKNQHLVRIDPTSEPSTQQKALLLGWERDMRALARMIGVVALLSVLAGVLVGVLVHDASLGIAASSGLAAVLSCLQVLAIWQFR